MFKQGPDFHFEISSYLRNRSQDNEIRLYNKYAALGAVNHGLHCSGISL